MFKIATTNQVYEIYNQSDELIAVVTLIKKDDDNKILDALLEV